MSGQCPICDSKGVHSITYEHHIQQIKVWLKTCLEDHHDCRWPETTPQLPTRVLALSLGDGTKDTRLIDGNGKNGHYAALTYCWGSCPDTIFKTTSHNVHQNRERIKFNDFNLLFREVITLLRSLDIPRLWIDALCIIEDHSADWESEASKMAAVYSNAHITVSAAVSTTPDEALFSDRFYSETNYPENFSLIDMENEVTNGSLSQRGWCLQERCLSRRIVHVGHKQMYWECAETSLNEHMFRTYPRRLCSWVRWFWARARFQLAGMCIYIRAGI